MSDYIGDIADRHGEIKRLFSRGKMLAIFRRLFPYITDSDERFELVLSHPICCKDDFCMLLN